MSLDRANEGDRRGGPGNDSGIASGREELWRSLADSLRAVQRQGLEGLTDKQLKDLGRLYRAAATHLSLLQAFGASTRQRDDLNRLVTSAHGVIYGRPRKGAGLRVFWTSLLAFPQSVRKLWRYHTTAALLLGCGLIYGFVGSARDMDWSLEFAMDDRTPFATREELLDTLLNGRPGQKTVEKSHRPRIELDSADKSFFAAVLWRHNTTIAVKSFFAGFLLGIPTVLILLQNGALLGVFSFTFHQHGLAYEWWAWILPHGITELLGVVLLSGAGLFIAQRILAPGELRRVASLHQAMVDALRHLFFAFPMLLVAALIESFVRQSSLSDTGRYFFAAASAALWAAYLGFGRVPTAVIARLEASRTLAERAIPLPSEEQILAAFATRRGPRG